MFNLYRVLECFDIDNKTIYFNLIRKVKLTVCSHLPNYSFQSYDLEILPLNDLRDLNVCHGNLIFDFGSHQPRRNERNCY